jgi:hypothetical protein
VANYCNRDFAGGTFTEYFPGGSEFAHLRNFPVDAVTSVKLDPAYFFGPDTVLPASGYVVHSERGVIQSLGGPFMPIGRTGLVNAHVEQGNRNPRAVQVVYSTLTGQVPGDVKEAYARLVGHGYRRVKTDLAANYQNVAQQKFADTFVIFTAASGALPADVTDLLAPYRVPLV